MLYRQNDQGSGCPFDLGYVIVLISLTVYSNQGDWKRRHDTVLNKIQKICFPSWQNGKITSIFSMSMTKDRGWRGAGAQPTCTKRWWAPGSQRPCRRASCLLLSPPWRWRTSEALWWLAALKQVDTEKQRWKAFLQCHWSIFTNAFCCY